MTLIEKVAPRWPDLPGGVLIALIGILYCWNLARVELSVTDECRSGVIVRDIVEGGHWLLPRTPDGSLCEKPLAYYSLSAILGSCLGINEWTLRGVSVLLGVGTLLITWILSRLFGSPKAAGAAVIALASNVIFMGSARAALVDMTLTFFMTLGFTAYLAARLGSLNRWAAVGICGGSFGLATLSKGPLGMVLPIVVTLGDALVEHRGRFWRAGTWWKEGLSACFLALAVAGVWYVPGALRGGKEFFETCILSENFRMPTGDAQGIGVSHRKPLLYYVGIQVAAVLPLLPLFPTWVSWAKNGASSRARRLLGVWAGCGFLLFQAAVNKRMYYLLPLQPPIAVAAGLAAEFALYSPNSRGHRASTAGVAILILLGSIGIVALCCHPEWIASLHERGLTDALLHQRTWVISSGLVLLCVGAALLDSCRREPGAMVRMSLVLALAVLAVRFGAGDRLESEFDRTRPFVRAMQSKLEKGQVPVIWPPVRGYSIDFYWPARILRDASAASEATCVLIARSGLSKVSMPFEILGTWKYGVNGRDDIVLVRVDRGR
jgi:hypothetical protein